MEANARCGTPGDGGRPPQTGQLEAVVDVDGIVGGEDASDRTWGITGIVGVDDGSIVVAGWAPGRHTHITVTDVKGRVMHQHKENIGFINASVSCDRLAESRVAVGCYLNRIGIYDLTRITYIGREISKILGSDTHQWQVKSLTTDNANSRIFVMANRKKIIGTVEGKELLIFDERLNHRSTKTLPRSIDATDMAYHDGLLFVCDYNVCRGGCYAFEVTNDSECKLVCEFSKPNSSVGDWGPVSWQPRSICASKNGDVFVLWETYHLRPQRKVTVKYNRGETKMLGVFEVNSQVSCITMMDTREGKKLIAGTHHRANICVYELE